MAAEIVTEAIKGDGMLLRVLWCKKHDNSSSGHMHRHNQRGLKMNTTIVLRRCSQGQAVERSTCTVYSGGEQDDDSVVCPIVLAGWYTSVRPGLHFTGHAKSLTRHRACKMVKPRRP